LPNNDIESLFATVVKRAMEAARTNGAAECPAPGIITAYCEHTISDGEHARWQEHFAVCSRCQSALEEVARAPEPAAAPLPGTVAESSLRAAGAKPHQWPLALLAAAVVTFVVAVTTVMSPAVGDVVHRAAEMSAPQVKAALGRIVPSASSLGLQNSEPAAPDRSRGVVAAASRNSTSVIAKVAPPAQRLVVPTAAGSAVLASTPKIISGTKPSVAALTPQRQIALAEKSSACPPPVASRVPTPEPRKKTTSATTETGPAGSRISKLAAPSTLMQRPLSRSAPRTFTYQPAAAPHPTDDVQHSQRARAARPAPMVMASARQASKSIGAGSATSKPTSSVASPTRMAAIYPPRPRRTDSSALPGPQGASVTIPEGTRITLANWQHYRAFMPEGMIALFSGQHGLKMPPDVKIDVGPPRHVVAPSSFRRATEEHNGQVRVVHLADGRNDVANYVAGEPFPNPSGPDKGYQILADLWYTYSPHLAVGMPGWGLWQVRMLDRFGNSTSAKWAFVYRQVAFNTDPGVMTTDPLAAGAFYTQWLMTDEPEQAKYTTDLDILPQDNQRDEANYLFFPALRRSVRFSVGARCAPLLGTDWTHDDQKPGFNGGLASFDAIYLRDMNMLAMVDLSAAVADFPSQYDMPLGFARPSWGDWSQRDTWVIDIRHIPSESVGYCYSKRVEYVDKETTRGLWEDLYDSEGKLWKVTMNAYYPRRVPGTDGETLYGRFAASTWDLQNQHATLGNSTDATGRTISFNSEVPRQFDDVAKYSTPGGLMQIMR